MIDFLFDEGCRLNDCDNVGYTAVMHASGPAKEFGLLEHMLKKGGSAGRGFPPPP